MRPLQLLNKQILSMDYLLYKFSLVAIKNQRLLQSFDENDKLKIEVKSKWNRNFLTYINNVFQLIVEEPEIKQLNEFTTPEVAFLFCVKVNEIKDVQYPKDCSSPTCFYFNIYIVTNKRKPHGKMSLGEEDLPTQRYNCVRRSFAEKPEVINYYRSSVCNKGEELRDEEFQFELKSINMEKELVIECYSYNENDYRFSDQKFIKKAWKSFRQLLDNKRQSRDFIGHVRMPISSLKESKDLWFDLLCKHSDPSHGVRAKIKLRISFKFENEQMQQKSKSFDFSTPRHSLSSRNSVTSASLPPRRLVTTTTTTNEERFMAKHAGNGYLTREYHRLCQIVFDYEKKMLKKQHQQQQNSSAMKWNNSLSDISRHFLKRFCDTFFIPNFSKDLIELFTFVEKLGTETSDLERGDFELIAWRIQTFSAKYEKQLNTMSEIFEEAQDTVESVLKSSLGLLNAYLTRYTSTFRTFPMFTASTVDVNLQLLVNLYAGLHTLFKHASTQPQHVDELKALFVDKLTNKVWEDVNAFINDVVKFEEATSEINDANSLKWISNLSLTIQNLSELIGEEKFSRNVLTEHMSYQKSVSLRISIKLCNPVRLAIKLLYEYQKIYRQFLPNMLESSKVSCELYLSCSELTRLLKLNVPDRELFKFKLNNLSDWFQETEMFTFWLETYDIILRHYFENAVASESFSRAASHVSYSDTAVVLTNNLLNMLKEWKRINFQNMELRCVGIGSMSEIITTYCRRYAIDVRDSLARVNYYFESEEPTNEAFMRSLKRISICVNNIHFIKNQVLNCLVDHLDLNEAIKNCEKNSENLSVVDAIKSTLFKSIEETLKDLNTITATIIGELKNHLSKYVQTLVYNLVNYNETTELLNFVDECFKFMNEDLVYYFSKPLACVLRTELVEFLVECFPDNKLWKFYENVFQFLTQIDQIWIENGFQPIMGQQQQNPRESSVSVCIDSIEFVQSLEKLMSKLKVYSEPTSSLVLGFLRYVNQTDHLVQSYGSMSSTFYYKIAFEETDSMGFVNINLKIINCNNIKIDLFKNNDVYMQAELLPYSLFDGQNKKTTRVMKKGENLVINETLEFKHISMNSFRTPNATLRLTLWEKDKSNMCTCLGESFHVLAQVEMMKPHHRTLNDMPAVKKVLGRLPKENLECLEELERRCEFDSEAREFLWSREMRMQSKQPTSGCGVSLEVPLNKLNDYLGSFKCLPLNDLVVFMRKKVE